MAHQLGEMKVANLIVLGALMEKIPFLKTASIHRVIEEVIENENLRALNLNLVVSTCGTTAESEP